MRLLHIGDHNVTGVLAVQGQVDDGAHTVAVVPGDAQLLHELVVAHGHGDAVHLGHHAVAAELLDIRDPLAVNGAAVGPLQALADGVGGGALRQGGVFQHLFPGKLIVVDAGDVEHALGQSAGFVKHHGFGFGQGFQIVGALDEDSLVAGAAQARKEAQGNADHQGAGAADHQEGQGAVQPGAPVAVKPRQQTQHRRQHRQGQGRPAHGGGIHPCELGDEVLRLGLVGAGIFHQLQDFGHGGLAEGPGGADLQHASHVDAAADDLVAAGDVPGQALAGEGGGVQGGGPLQHHAVQRDLLAGLDHDDGPHGHIVRVHLGQLSVLLDVGIVGADVHQCGDVPAALAHGVALEQLTDLIEQHHGHGLHEVAAFLVKRQADGAHGGHSHQEVLVEHLAPEDALAGLAEDIIADDQIRRQIQQRPGQAPDGKQPDGQDQHRRDDDAAEHLFLLLGHASSPPSADVPEWLPARVVFHR